MLNNKESASRVGSAGDFTYDLSTQDGKDRVCGLLPPRRARRMVISSLIFWCSPYFSAYKVLFVLNSLFYLSSTSCSALLDTVHQSKTWSRPFLSSLRQRWKYPTLWQAISLDRTLLPASPSRAFVQLPWTPSLKGLSSLSA